MVEFAVGVRINAGEAAGEFGGALGSSHWKNFPYAVIPAGSSGLTNRFRLCIFSSSALRRQFSHDTIRFCMNAEMLTMLDYLERERGISRDVLVEAISGALLTASKKAFAIARELRIDINPKTGDIRAFAKPLVVEKVENQHDEIALAKARQFKADAQIGEEIEIEVTPKDFGRIAAQTARQAIMQRIRQIEKDMIYEEFKDRAGEIVSGTVRRFERSDVIIDLGRFEAVMPSRERVPTEEYSVGDRIRAYVVAVENGTRGPEIILSRSHPNFVRRLFEVEVSEIGDRTVNSRPSPARPAPARRSPSTVPMTRLIPSAPASACAARV